jgi:hypothetical protein
MTPEERHHLEKNSPRDTPFNRRAFLKNAAGTALALAGPASSGGAKPEASTTSSRLDGTGTAIRALYDTLTDRQKKEICFAWDYRATPVFGRTPVPSKDGKALPLRLHVSNAWRITPPAITNRFFTREQQQLIQAVFRGIFQPGWPEKLARQAKDDTGQAWGEGQSIALFGTPGKGPVQCVFTGFHLTVRALSDPKSQVAFGGAIAHGHQPSGFYEKPGHPGNIFWYQALLANKVYQILDGKQRRQALIAKGMPYYEYGGKIDRSLVLPGEKYDRPREPDVRFRGPKGTLPGLPVSGMTRDQKEAVQKVLRGLLDPYRKEYQDQVLTYLTKQGGIDKCHLVFYQEHPLDKEGRWDNWRLEGPSFVWYFRGYPHVHIWIHVADDPSVPVTSYFG